MASGQTAVGRGTDATGPIEWMQQGTRRDEVRLFVSTPGTKSQHSRFLHLGEFLDKGDVVVVNDSGTLPAAVAGVLPGGEEVRVHLSTPCRSGEPGIRLVELRTPEGIGSSRRRQAVPDGTIVRLPDQASAMIIDPYGACSDARLYRASLSLYNSLQGYLYEHGEPIRYGYVAHEWCLRSYQTIFARNPGSSEMPSAGRPFSSRLLKDLTERGVKVVPITLHTGVASLERGEAPYAEPYAVSESAAEAINAARERGSRVLATGTTVVRALETVWNGGGVVAREDFTDLVITRDRELHAIDGIITGWHEPEASHLAILEAVAGPEAVEAAYCEAAQANYKWHEFGDSCLFLTR